MLKLERTWWFILLTNSLTVIGTMYLLKAAGIASPEGLAQWLLYAGCFATISQIVSFLGRVLIVLLAPSSTLAARCGTAAKR
jgi:hypothetical protein